MNYYVNFRNQCTYFIALSLLFHLLNLITIEFTGYYINSALQSTKYKSLLFFTFTWLINKSETQGEKIIGSACKIRNWEDFVLLSSFTFLEACFHAKLIYKIVCSKLCSVLWKWIQHFNSTMKQFQISIFCTTNILGFHGTEMLT